MSRKKSGILLTTTYSLLTRRDFPFIRNQPISSSLHDLPPRRALPREPADRAGVRIARLLHQLVSGSQFRRNAALLHTVALRAAALLGFGTDPRNFAAPRRLYGLRNDRPGAVSPAGTAHLVDCSDDLCGIHFD